MSLKKLTFWEIIGWSIIFSLIFLISGIFFRKQLIQFAKSILDIIGYK